MPYQQQHSICNNVLLKNILNLLEIILNEQQISYNILRKPPFLKVVKNYVVGNGFKVQRK